MKESCPTCHLSLATGNRVGAYIFNIAAAEIVMTIVLLAIVLRTWPARRGECCNTSPQA